MSVVSQSIGMEVHADRIVKSEVKALCREFDVDHRALSIAVIVLWHVVIKVRRPDLKLIKQAP